MELPGALRLAVDRALDGVALADLAQAAEALSQRYRAERRDDRFHLADDMAARAYLATRLPATYAATRASLAAVAERRPDFAPCPHAATCPLAPPDWCHFSRRVARSRLHRQAKGAAVPWEDEKYCYLAAARRPGLPAAARIIAPPRAGSGRIGLKLCGGTARPQSGC